MPVKIKAIEPGSIAERLGWNVGDQIHMINDRSVADVIDFRFLTSDEHLVFKIRQNGVLGEQTVEKDAYDPIGVDLEEFRIRGCGDDCIFCFVDQNPAGLREALYFRDSDFRMSFLYGNYITVTNLRERDMQRIVEQRLSPVYISVHCTDEEIRRRLMGHRSQDDRLMEKLAFFREHGIEMHSQIVLVPGFNDGEALVRTVHDLFEMHDAMRSVSIVPVGLTGHRRNLADLRCVTPEEARRLAGQVHRWQDHFRRSIGRGFVYLSDEMYLLAGEDFPLEDDYDGFPLIENGVGMCRDFLNEFAFQQEEFPGRLEAPRRVTMVTGELAAPFLRERIVPVLDRIGNLQVDLVTAENTLFGRPVTVSGLLSFNCFYQALRGKDPGHHVFLPPDCVNFEGLFLDNRPGRNSPDDLARILGSGVSVFDGDWMGLIGESAPVAEAVR